MIKNNFQAKLLGFWYFYRWHPEVALRYLPIVSEINKLGPKKSVLDVGSGGLGIAPYLKRQVTGVDVNFQKPFHPLLQRVKGNALRLPFENRSFDTVISVDMLEHLKNKERGQAIEELLRVARLKVIIAVPCGIDAYLQDLKLAKFYKKKFGRDYNFLSEQIDLGLPEADELSNIILLAARSLKKNITIKILPNENLKLREFLMNGWMTYNLIIDLISRKFFLFFIPVFIRFNHKPYYRQIFIIDYKK